jgi:hypothetical protein
MTRSWSPVSPVQLQAVKNDQAQRSCPPMPASRSEYLTYYNRYRPHQSRQQRPPDIGTQPLRDMAGLRSVRRKPVTTGLLNEYHLGAAGAYRGIRATIDGPQAHLVNADMDLSCHFIVNYAVSGVTDPEHAME